MQIMHEYNGESSSNEPFFGSFGPSDLFVSVSTFCTYVEGNDDDDERKKS